MVKAAVRFHMCLYDELVILKRLHILGVANDSRGSGIIMQGGTSVNLENALCIEQY